MSVNRLALLAPLLGCFLGCASSYQVAGERNTAEFSVASQSDSSGTFVRNTWAWAFANENCDPSKFGTRLGSQAGNSASAQSTPVKIAAGEEFVFTGVYNEQRMGQGRTCRATGKFTPQVGRKYMARVTSTNNVQECQLGVYDVTDGGETPVQDFSMPPHACLDNSPERPPNGKPLWGNIRVRVQTVPK
jgi:hypothetical protein